jgi:hypothetical protein
MQKKTTLWLMVTLSVLLTLLAACRSVSTNTTTTSKTSTVATTVPPGENIYVLDGYTPSGSIPNGQQIVAIHPASANPASSFSLPAGPGSQDHHRLYVATPANGRTTISIVNTQNGLKLRTFTIPGTYSTAAANYDIASLSTSGQWLALRELGQTANETTIALVDTHAGKLQTINFKDYTSRNLPWAKRLC